MPMYEFKTDDGEVVEVFMPFAEYDRRVKKGRITLDDGRKAVVNWDSFRMMSTVPGNYPMVSSAAGVHPDQVKDQMDHLRKMGCGQVDHTKDGDVIFTSKSQRKQVCEVLGLYDRNGGYGDPQAKHVTRTRKFR